MLTVPVCRAARYAEGRGSQRVKWPELVTAMHLPDVHFHDLRHAGNIWASKAGMSTKDLMARMGTTTCARS